MRTPNYAIDRSAIVIRRRNRTITINSGRGLCDDTIVRQIDPRTYVVINYNASLPYIGADIYTIDAADGQAYSVADFFLQGEQVGEAFRRDLGDYSPRTIVRKCLDLTAEFN